MSLSGWRLTPEMNKCRSGACAAVLGNGKVMVMGGYDGEMLWGGAKSSETYQAVPDFYKYLLLIRQLREIGGQIVTVAHNKGEPAQVLILLTHLANLPWDIVVHIVRFIDRPKLNPWGFTPAMDSARSGACAAVLNSQVIVLGGYDDRQILKSCEMYDPVQKQWCPIPDMTTERSGACAVVLDNKVIVIGGFAGGSNDGLTHKSCEIYGSVQKQWCSFPDMTTKRWGACAAVVDGKVIVMGGFDDTETTLKSCEMYDPVQKQWCPIPDMTTERSGACAVVLDGKVIVMGGYARDQNTHKSCEMYDPIQNQWCSFPAMNNERDAACAAVVNGKVIVIGGNTRGVPLRSCEMYDPVQKQ